MKKVTLTFTTEKSTKFINDKLEAFVEKLGKQENDTADWKIK